MSAGGEQLFDDSHRVADLYGIVNALLRHADASLAKRLEHVRFLNTLQTVKCEITNNRQLFHFENDVHAAAWTVFSENTCCRFVEESQRQECLVVALDLFNVVRVAWPGLDVIKDVVFAQTTITNDIDAFNETLRLILLGFDDFRRREGCGDYCE